MNTNHSIPVPVKTKMDARLRAIMSLPAEQLRPLYRAEEARVSHARSPASSMGAASVFHGVFSAEEITDEVSFSVMIKFKGAIEQLRIDGVNIYGGIGDLAIANVSREALDKLEGNDNVVFIELTRPARRFEPDLVQSSRERQPVSARERKPASARDLKPPASQPASRQRSSMEAIGVLAWHTLSHPITGEGTVIGVIDSTGLDFHHPAFQIPQTSIQPEAPKTRLLSLWDQRGTRSGDGDQPDGVRQLGTDHPCGGLEYVAEDINADLASGEPYTRVRQIPEVYASRPNHGTHVAGIAAGNGALSARRENVGVAPDAGIIYVNTFDSYTSGFADLGGVALALMYIFDEAAKQKKPCVVNISLGDTLGPHDGTSLVEQWIDYSLATPGRAVVVAAGNHNLTGKHVTFGHEKGASDREWRLHFFVDPNTIHGETIEIWYPQAVRLSVAVDVPPGSYRVGPVVVTPDEPRKIVREKICHDTAMDVIISSVLHDARNGDNCISIMLMPEPGQPLPRGDWTITLRAEGETGTSDPWKGHGWIDVNTSMRWDDPVQDDCTLTTPGTARKVITVGRCGAGGASDIDRSSGCGPTRDGRPKPELVAPGSNIMAPTSGAYPPAPYRSPGYMAGSGTSQAAPHVAGLISLIYSYEKATLASLTIEQVRYVLWQSARFGTTSHACAWGQAYTPELHHLTTIPCCPPLDLPVRPPLDDPNQYGPISTPIEIHYDQQQVDVGCYALTTRQADGSIVNIGRLFVKQETGARTEYWKFYSASFNGPESVSPLIITYDMGSDTSDLAGCSSKVTDTVRQTVMSTCRSQVSLAEFKAPAGMTSPESMDGYYTLKDYEIAVGALMVTTDSSSPPKRIERWRLNSMFQEPSSGHNPEWTFERVDKDLASGLTEISSESLSTGEQVIVAICESTVASA